MKRVFTLLLLVFSSSLFCSENIIQVGPSGKGDKVKVSLTYAIQRTLNYNGELAGERRGIDLAQGRIDQARAALFPKAEVYLMGAPIFEHTGDALQSTSNWSKWGVFTTLRGTVIQPIYTFGVVDEYKKAAKSGYEVEENKIRGKEEDLIYRTKQFYYGLQLANDMVDLSGEAKEKMDAAVKKAEELLEEGKIKRVDMYALKTFYAQIKIKSDEALRGKYLAEKALVWVMGLPRDTHLILDEEYLYPQEQKIKDEEYYVSTAVETSPDLRMLASGIEATKALWQGQAKQKRPAFFGMGYAGISYSNVNDKQNSVFANDPFNNMSGAVLFGLRFNLDWWTINAMSKQSKAEYEKLLYSKDTLTEGKILQVRKTYREVLDYKKAVEYAEEGESNGNKWFMNAALGYGIGTSENVDDLIDAMKGYFEAKINYNMAIFNYNMALAELTRMTGKEVVSALKYR